MRNLNAVLDPVAVSFEPSGNFLTVSQLEQETARFAYAMRVLGLQPGETIAWLLDNGPDFVIAAVGAQRAGYTQFALNTHIPPSDVLALVNQLQPKVLITSREHLRRKGMFAALSTLSDRVACILIGTGMDGWLGYDTLMPHGTVTWEGMEAEQPGKSLLSSGGSTGRPKIVVQNSDDQVDVSSLIAGRGDIQFIPQPLYHSAPHTLLLAALGNAASVVIMDKWDTEVALRAIQTYGVTHAFLVPTMMKRVTDLPTSTLEQIDLSSLRLVVHGAAPCSVSVKKAWLDLVSPHCTTIDGYGSSELGMIAAITDREWRERPGSVGRPVGCQVVIRDEQGRALGAGQVGVVWVIRGNDQSMRYLGNKAETTACQVMRDGRLEATNFDLGQMDEAGYLYLAGRAKDMVISGGANIYPIRTEEVLLTHSAVADAVVVGVPDDDLGEVLVAVVQLNSDHSETLELMQELMRMCREPLGTFGTPRQILFGAIPRTDAGKVNKNRVRQMYSLG